MESALCTLAEENNKLKRNRRLTEKIFDAQVSIEILKNSRISDRLGLILRLVIDLKDRTINRN